MTTASAPGGNIKVDYRAALAADSRDIARFICIAGDGLHEFLFDDLVPLMSAVDFLTIGVWSEDYPISHRNCFVAVDSATGEVLGAANAFPADDLKEQEYALVPAQRQDHIRALLQLQDWGSMFLNALAVSETCRGLGVGTRLLDWAQERAEAGGFDRLSLHVWQDNMTAVNFYQARGFVETGHCSGREPSAATARRKYPHAADVGTGRFSPPGCRRRAITLMVSGRSI